ncbi:MAG: hypothetical protein ACPG70_04030 [Candidatus Puniceispirillaceae bacterium]
MFAVEILASIGSLSGITSIRLTIMPTPSNIEKNAGQAGNTIHDINHDRIAIG